MGGRTVDHGIVGVKEEDEEEESLSLCDLPMNEGNNLPSSKESSVANNDELQEEFNFCDSFTSSKEYSEMCAADELFFQGQILPLRRHSVSCTHTDDTTSRFISSARLQSDHIRYAGNASGCSSISRSDSFDRCYSGGLTSTAASSRSSSVNSHHSSSSGSSSAAVAKHKKPSSSSSRPPRLLPNHFQYSSHPSPKPQIRTTSSGTKNSKPNPNKNSGLWSLFRVGLMTPPEIAIRDLKNRSKSIKNYNHQSFGSRNSTGSNSSTTTKTITPAKRKQPFSFNKNGVLLFGGCKCTASLVVGPNPTGIGHDAHRRSGGVTANPREEEQKQHATKMTKHHQQTGGRKQALSRHRTFEWLKQLSLDAAAMDQT